MPFIIRIPNEVFNVFKSQMNPLIEAMITEQDDLYFGWRENLKKSTERMGQAIYLSLCKKVKDEMVSSVTVFGKISSIFGNYFSVYIAFGKFLAYLFLYVFCY